jgi:hypothetical protein
MLDREHGAKAYNVICQTASDAGVRSQPIELLKFWPATGAVHSEPRNDQDGPCVEDVQVADSPYSNVVDLVHLLEATTTPFDATGTRFQIDLDHGMGLAVLEINSETANAKDPVAFPAAEDCRKFIVGQRWISCLSGLATVYHQAG